VGFSLRLGLRKKGSSSVTTAENFSDPFLPLPFSVEENSGPAAAQERYYQTSTPLKALKGDVG
jgi:hypothetical protein